MKLSPHQVRAVLEINEQTLRYWKRAYPALAGRRGYGPCYSFSEVLVLMITKRLVEQLGVEISKLAPVSEALFSACRESVRLLSGPGETLWIDIEAMSLSTEDRNVPGGGNIKIALPLRTLAMELRARVMRALGDDEVAQMVLPLGPTFVAVGQRKEGT